MTVPQLFSDKELGQLDGVYAAKSGTAEDQFFQECTSVLRVWLQTRELRKEPPAPDNQAILFIFAETPLVEFGFEQTAVGPPKKIRKKLGTLGEGIVVCNQNFKVMLKVRDSVTIEDAYEFAETWLSSSVSFAIAKVGQYKIQIHRALQDLDDWLDDPEEITVNIDDIDLTPEVIADDLERFHDAYLSTHLARAARHMWTLPEGECQHRLGPQPEEHVQSFLLSHLDGLYGRASVFVHEEVKNKGGRTDISIARPSPGKSGKVNTVLELKVLAPTNSFTVNNTWGLKGVEQADGYRNPDTDAAFACLFDARREKLDMPDLAPFAMSKNVLVKIYSMGIPADKVLKPEAKAKAK
ncbi:hypothetical protein [Pseudomonas protegens]|uniref:hypothetical protein n=1 Tax=Pseudomonas protegens TaxID=380021 RepID=UPI00069DFD99|nr:hypothetical protein [Pseudomonas protegens]